jgi:lycopene cyclase domain-containing protein
MKTLYLLLDGLTLLFPLLLSFDKKVAFYQKWKLVGYGFLMVGIPFIIWDIYFTSQGVWGFNSNYLTGINMGNLPIEEVLFFLVVPFACTFIYACVLAYFSKVKLEKFNRLFYVILSLYAVTVLIIGKGGDYSFSVFILTLLTIVFVAKTNLDLTFLPLSFCIALIPFFVVNGVLTGTGLEGPIVWYDNTENTGLRFFTIPIDDVLYAWVLIMANIVVYIFYDQKKTRKSRITTK